MEKLKIELKKCDFVRFTFSDIHGIHRGRIAPQKSVDKYLEEGIGTFGGLLNIHKIITSLYFILFQ